ncbi:lyase family protein, partial [Bacillus cereus]|nr:lyase family protein [Bacillus cereus]
MKAEDSRVEVDLLGEREVPAEKYYGVHTLRALENFQISSGRMNNEPEFIRGMVQVKKAAALANRELRVLSED